MNASSKREQNGRNENGPNSLIRWSCLKRHRVHKIRDRVHVPGALTDDDFVLDVALSGELVPDNIKDRLRKSELDIINDIYLGRKIATDILLNIEQLSLLNGLNMDFTGH